MAASIIRSTLVGFDFANVNLHLNVQGYVLCIFTQFCEQKLTKLGENTVFRAKNTRKTPPKTCF